MDVVDLLRQAEIDSKTVIYVFNPLKYDFVGHFDVNRNGKPVTYTIPSKETAKYVKPVALALGNQIKDLYLSDKKLPNPQLEERAEKLIFPE